MRVREYGRPAMTLGFLAAILAAVPLGTAPLPHGVGFLRAGALAEEAAAAGGGAASDAGRGDPTTGAGAAGRQGNVDGSRGSGGVSAGRSVDGAAGSGGTSVDGGGSEADAAGSAADDEGTGGRDDRGGVSATGKSSAAESSEDSSAGSVEADAPGRSPEMSRGAATVGAIALPSVSGSAANEDAADADAVDGPEDAAEDAAEAVDPHAAGLGAKGAGAPDARATSAPGAGAKGAGAPSGSATVGSATGGNAPAGDANETGANETDVNDAGAKDTGAPSAGAAGVNLGATRGLAPIRGEESGGAAGSNAGNGAASKGESPAAAVAPLRVVRAERNAAGIEVLYTSQVRERIIDGRYEMMDATGTVVADRPATPRDIERLRDNVRLSGLGAVSEASLPAASDVESVAVSQRGMVVRYRAGWTEDLSGDRYRFADPDGNTVVDRPATLEDRNRLLAIAGG